MPLAAIIFDVDGTLADTEREGHLPAFNSAFAQAGLPWHWDAALYAELLTTTGGKERMQRYAAECDPQRCAQPGWDDLLRRVHGLKNAAFARRVHSGALPLRPGVRAWLEAARACGIERAIATTTSAENVQVLLQAHLPGTSAEWFSVIGAGDIVAAKKPAADIYLWVLQRLQLPAAQCLAIEDSAIGVQAACAAGIRTLATPNGFTAGQDFSLAWKVVASLEQITLAQLRQEFPA